MFDLPIRRSLCALACGLLSASCIASFASQASADPDVVTAAHEEVTVDPNATVFGKVVQVGAKVLAKGPAKTPTDKEILDAEPRGNSTAASRKQALAALPLEQLTPEQRDRVKEITGSISYYRRLPKVSFPVEPEIYSFFLAHPDVAVSIWRAMQISKLQMFQTGKYEYEADAGDGSVGAIEVLYSGAEKHLAICTGEFQSPFFKNSIEARSLVLLQTSFITEPDGSTVVTHRADLFISFPSQTIDVAAKIFSPLTINMTDRTFTEISMFVRMMSLGMTRRPDWVEQIAEKLDGVPDIRRKQILELAAQMHTQALRRAARQASFAGSWEDEQDGVRPAVPQIEPAVDRAAPRKLPAARGSSPVRPNRRD
ncbi:MAG: hypothetical protein EHM42_04385 [Planctomycetaceae bacterium]|nr:MAG: hypothetical protein EHM42_04385 [Planctomycetaceae bacterium]